MLPFELFILLFIIKAFLFPKFWKKSLFPLILLLFIFEFEYITLYLFFEFEFPFIFLFLISLFILEL